MAASNPVSIARIQQLITLGVLATAALWFWIFWQFGHGVIAFAGATAAVGAHAVVLGVEFLFLKAVHGSDPAPVATARQLLRAWAGEVVSAPKVFCWRQPFCSRRWPDHLPANAQGHRGVLLIHGLVCNRGVWNAWLERLSAQGTPMIAVNLEPVFGPIEAYVDCIDAAVAALQRCTGVPPVAVAHSMGGLALRHWCVERDSDGKRLTGAITIGTPHQGTWLARFGATRNARQMRLSSPWLTALAARGTAACAARFTCFYGNCDNIVFPAAAGRLLDADNRLLPGVAHVQMVDRPEPWAELQRRLAAPFAAAAPSS